MRKVLIVDDESWVVESLKDLVDWNQYGFEVVAQAHNGAEALEVIKELDPDVVFTDIRMPEMNGLELIQRGRSVSSRIQFVVVSGYAEFAYAQKALTFGAVAYCLKPFDEIEISGVLMKIKKTLDGAQPVQDFSLMHLLDELSAENQSKLREEFRKFHLSDWSTTGFVAVVSVGPRELPDFYEPVLKLKIGTSKTAYLFGAGEVESRRRKWIDHFPPGTKGIGIGAITTDLSAIKDAIAIADVLAHQFFVNARAGVFDARSYRQDELNKRMLDMKEAIRDKDLKKAQVVFDELESLFLTHELSVRHAFQVYNMTVSFLFGLGQSENILYSYEQLIQSYPDVSAMLDELRKLTARYMRSSDSPSVETKNQTFNAILQFVTSHFNEDISLQDLSDQFFMNPSYISQLFKKEVGETFTAYIARIRIANACELLNADNLSVHEIAERMGYHDYFYFTRIFKKITGKTPTQYREEHR
ncbi:response regulator transcription factor [Cohnella lupini]|uniref:Two-component system response regulator YesN n=1 Tax=Cohnella lupini TaxID=1294267 RepID=A0A3D9INF4_9BACL|nr:response regulator transcription factor [Cohnella lupini]RED63255.1 two-component system response regulator YesN [Cohnella lupini]